MLSEVEVHAVPVFVLERLHESCDDDSELAREVVLDFLDSAPDRLSKLAAAVVCVDPQRVRLEAHSIKGSSRTIGAEALAEVAARLEEVGKNGDMTDATSLLAEAELRTVALIGALKDYLADVQK